MAKKIKVNIFDDMQEALHDAAVYERGGALNLRVSRIPARPRQRIVNVPNTSNVWAAVAQFSWSET
jgi:hypothetical protein